MVKVSQMFLLVGSLCLVSPVMAEQPKPQPQMSFQEIIEASKEIDQLDDGDYDDGDYAAVPVENDYKAQAKKVSKPVAKSKVDKKPQARATSKEKPVVVSTKADARDKTYALKEKWEKRSSIPAFE